jgi:hypothetical protein
MFGLMRWLEANCMFNGRALLRWLSNLALAIAWFLILTASITTEIPRDNLTAAGLLLTFYLAYRLWVSQSKT